MPGKFSENENSRMNRKRRIFRCLTINRIWNLVLEPRQAVLFTSQKIFHQVAHISLVSKQNDLFFSEITKLQKFPSNYLGNRPPRGADSQQILNENLIEENLLNFLIADRCFHEH